MTRAVTLDPSANENCEPLLRAYMPELETIRGFAIVAVLFFHGLTRAGDLSLFTPWQRHFLTLVAVGKFGVNLFFVLSGFLITGILLESRNLPDYFRRFYFRRALRILPAYYLTLFLLVLFGLTSKGFLFMSLAYSSNLSPLFGIGLSYPVLWSLAVEEHFYLIWPLAVRRISPTKLLWVLYGILLACPIIRLLYHEHAAATIFVPVEYAHYTWNNLDGLALGAIIAILVRRHDWDRKKMFRLATLFTISSFLIAFAGYPFGLFSRLTPMGDALQQVPWNLAFAGLLSFFLLLGSGNWKQWVTPIPMTFFGKISYGLYLCHLMVFSGYEWADRQTGFVSRFKFSPWQQVWLKMLVAGTAALTIAYLSRRYFEEPFLRLKDWRPARQGQGEKASEPIKAISADWPKGTGYQEPPQKLPRR
jgi:peptidoglycan/LPS O-acetylase OafA/YrhL